MLSHELFEAFVVDGEMFWGNDRLVLAPGIQIDEAYGLSAADYDSRTPHAWQAGPQTQLLHDQIARAVEVSMELGEEGTVSRNNDALGRLEQTAPAAMASLARG